LPGQSPSSMRNFFVRKKGRARSDAAFAFLFYPCLDL